MLIHWLCKAGTGGVNLENMEAEVDDEDDPHPSFVVTGDELKK